MPEQIADKTIFSLSEVCGSIERIISDRFKSVYWIKAEVNKLNYYKQSGHCYPELVEKNAGRIVAQFRSNLWKDDYLAINKKFLTILKEPLKDGIKVLLLARISFDAVYGLSLRILDIDPQYTLGDLEQEKLLTLSKLKEEGIYNNNKLLDFPRLPQRIAIISVETSKGYADFINIIQGNPWNYKFFYFLFPSLLQGDNAVQGIINQLKRIKKIRHHFDVVAIIRGGGGDIGLSCYNHYKLAKAIAEYPMPVLTGIGHATNETVAEMVSFSNAITPSKLAEYLIQHFHDFSLPVQKARETIIAKSRNLLQESNKNFNTEIRSFKSLTRHILLQTNNSLDFLKRNLIQQSQAVIKSNYRNLQTDQVQISRELNLKFKSEKLVLNNLEKNLEHLSPSNVLKRGYSISRVQGKAILDANELTVGTILETEFYKGQANSRVEQINAKTL